MPRQSGLSPRRERFWGLVGGFVGSLAGVGAALVAVFLDGSAWTEAGRLYPTIFERHEFLVLDFYLLGMLCVGAALSGFGLFYARTSPFPRTDAYGGGLIGELLMVLGGLVLFVRLVALIDNPG